MVAAELGEIEGVFRAMTTQPDIYEDDMTLAEYALGVLPYGERKAFEAKLAASAPLRARLATWDQNLVPLSSDYQPALAPLSVIENVESRLFGAQKSVASSWWHNVQLWRSAAFASVLGALILGGMVFADRTEPGAFNANYIAEIKSESDDIRLAAAFDAGQNQLKFNRIIGSAKAERAFEIWLIAEGDAPISLGLVPMDNSFTVSLNEAVAAKLSSTSVLAISDEPSGGSSTGQPTGAVLALGQIAQI